MATKPVICVGIVAYDGLDGRVAQDYMRLMFHLGRRHQGYDFQLAIKYKSEQFRARNAIVKAALQFRADYIWMLDDDHVLDIDTNRPSGIIADSPYDLPIKLVRHLEQNKKIGIVGALYYQRGGDYYPVIMQESVDDERPYFLSQAEVSRRMQMVDVTGGGCMMIRASIFDKIEDPWFAPEHEWGTDVQLCKQARKAGYEVWCDTSLEIGHLHAEKQLVTSAFVDRKKIDSDYKPLVRYRTDVLEFLHMDIEQVFSLAEEYFPNMSEMKNYPSLIEYYASRGPSQLARQCMFHHHPAIIEQMKFFHSIIRTDRPARGADYGCGSAPIGFELALQGHEMDFIDVDGCTAFEFTKWRAAKHGIKCGWELKGPYDYVLMMDSIEHIEDWKGTLEKVVASIKPGGVLITNYFRNTDFDNIEHVSMDHEAVRSFLRDYGFTTESEMFWVKYSAEEEEAA